MIDRLVHHAEVVNLKGDSYRLAATMTATEMNVTGGAIVD
jgi:DNA replication protein DnaC